MIVIKQLALGLVGVLAVCGTASPALAAPPKLILQVTVDQLRGDLPDKYMKNMGEGGFRYLKKEGIWYANADFSYAATETAVGHTTLATGANPSEHGIISNVWFDRESGKLVYAIEDAQYHVLTPGADVDQKREIDSTQKLASTDGRSPRNIMVSTFSDELSIQTSGKAKIFAVSIKDRGAVTLAGHAGKAFWFSKSSGQFITTSYYYDQYPAWVDAWNQKKAARAFDGKSWNLLLDQSTYLFAGDDDNEWEMDVAGFGRVFPHHYGSADSAYFNTLLTFSPAGDELTLDFAKTIIDAEELGQDEVTDFLAISFSSTDYVGHGFGPSSLEAEDNLLRLDRTLANLFAYVDENIGLENTLIVLSADHGSPEAPGFLKRFGIDSGFFSLDQWNEKPSLPTVKKKFRVGREIIQSFYPPYVYLNHKLIQKKRFNLAEVELAVAADLMNIKSVALAVSSSALRQNKLSDTFLNRAAIHSYNEKRSGDLLILFKPYYFVNGSGGKVMAASHGGPWRYDTFVPLVFAGGTMTGQRIYRSVEPKDIAPTLASILGTKPPSAATGEPLLEVMQASRQ